MDGTVGRMVVGDLEIRPSEYVAYAGGRPLRLTVRELDLLTALAERRDRIVSREELYRVVWEDQYRRTDRSVDVYIARLRQKLGEAIPDREYIHTHFGFGYRLSSE
ncbi:MAG TPA: helix-turn-helix domain-containing protein [Thermoleophilaceae bacterium]|nr:helix-turn-helix domain-containing protein [Thermoleophilaceae bacterium]